MLILDSTTKTIKAVLAAVVATTQPVFTAHYADSTASAFTEASSDGALNSTTAVEVVAAPGASTRRIIKEITVYNGDTTAVTLYLSLDNNGTNRIIVKVVLLAGETYSLANSTSPYGITSTARVQYVTNAATITPNADSDDCVEISAIAQAFTIANPSGTPVNFQKLVIRIKDNGVARAITWGNGYSILAVALPTTTVLSKITMCGFLYNTANGLNKWQLTSFLQEA